MAILREVYLEQYSSLFRIIANRRPREIDRDTKMNGIKYQKNKAGLWWKVIDWVEGNKAESNGTRGNSVCVGTEQNE